MSYKDIYFHDFYLSSEVYGNKFYLDTLTGEIIYHHRTKSSYIQIKVDINLDPKYVKGAIIADLVLLEKVCFLTNVRKQTPTYKNPVIHREYYPNVVTKSRYFKKTKNVYTKEVIDIKWDDMNFSHLLSKEESEFPYKEDALHQSDTWIIAPKQRIVLLTSEKHNLLGGCRQGEERIEKEVEYTSKSSPLSLKLFAVSKGAEWKANRFREEPHIDAVLSPRRSSGKWIEKTDEELYPEYVDEYKKSYLPNFVAQNERQTRKQITIKRPYKHLNEEYGIDVLIVQIYTQQAYFDADKRSFIYTAPTFVKEEVERFEFDLNKINEQFLKEFKDQVI